MRKRERDLILTLNVPSFSGGEKEMETDWYEERGSVGYIETSFITTSRQELKLSV